MQFCKLTDDWESITDVILYGYGAVGKACLGSIRKSFSVAYIIDNDIEKQGQRVQDLCIYSVAKGIEKRANRKIIVLTGGRVYLEISNELRRRGLEEYKDFCSIEFFITEWYWKYKKQNCLMEIHTAITMQCTLKCRYCNMFVPYYSDKLIYSLRVLQSEFDLLFKKIDFIFCLTLLGGEPLLHPNFSEIIQYLCKKYRDKIGVIKVITNGTVVPKDDVLETMKLCPIWISVSDYTEQVNYVEKMEAFKSSLEKYSIDYTIVKMKQWSDFCFPHRLINIKNCKEHMKACAPIFHGYNDNKIYYCHVAWSAEKIGRIKLSETDYVDLRDVANDDSRHNIARHCLGIMENGYVSFCQVCGGCGKDNFRRVIAGEQW